MRAFSRSDPYGLASEAGVTVQLGSVDSPSDLRVVLDGASVVVVAMGGMFPARSQRQPLADLQSSVPGVIQICEAIAAEGGSPRVILVSSAGSVYAPSVDIIAEDVTPAPTSPYGVSRLACEGYLGYYAGLHGWAATSVRVSYVYGRLLPRNRGQNLPSVAAWAAATGETLTLLGGGLQVRDFVHVDDVADAVVALTTCPRSLPAVLNLGSGEGSSVVDVVSEVERASGRRIEVRDVEAEGLKDVGRLVLDTSLLRRTIRFAPRPLSDGIRQMIVVSHDVAATR